MQIGIHFILGVCFGLGMIGFVFTGMGNTLLACALFFPLSIFSVIGLPVSLKSLLFGRKNKT